MERANVQVKLQNGKTVNVAWDASGKPSFIIPNFILPLLETNSLQETIAFIEQNPHCAYGQERLNASYVYAVNIKQKNINAWKARYLPWNEKWSVTRTKSTNIQCEVDAELKGV